MIYAIIKEKITEAHPPIYAIFVLGRNSEGKSCWIFDFDVIKQKYPSPFFDDHQQEQIKATHLPILDRTYPPLRGRRGDDGTYNFDEKEYREALSEQQSSDT